MRQQTLSIRHVVTVLASVLLIGLAGCASKTVAGSGSGPTAEGKVWVYGGKRHFDLVAAEGNDVPLHRAIKLLVPADYAVQWVEVHPQWRELPVSWRAGQDWPSALRQALVRAPAIMIDITTGIPLVLVRQTGRGVPTPAPAPVVKPVAALMDLPAVPEIAGPGRKTEGTAAKSLSTRQGLYRKVSLPGQADSLPGSTSANAEAVMRWALGEQDKTLKGAVERWARSAGWRLFWELGVDYRLDAAVSINGSFEDAVAAVVHSMGEADVPPKAIFYRGNQVLRMVARGME